jgi:uncharacterized protein (DUF697 family)
MAKKRATRTRARARSQAADAVNLVKENPEVRAAVVQALKKEIEEGSQAQRVLGLVGEPTTAGFDPGIAALLSNAAAEAQSFKLSFLRKLSAAEPTTATTLIEQQTKDAQETVNLYSLVAAGIGLLPGMGLSFIGVFATQVLMVQKIAEAFGRDLSNSKTTTAITALLGTGFGEGVGGGLKALTFSAFPSPIGGVLGVVAGPVATYAACQAVGSVFITAFQNENRQEVTKGLAGQVQQLIGPSALRRRPAA